MWSSTAEYSRANGGGRGLSINDRRLRAALPTIHALTAKAVVGEIYCDAIQGVSQELRLRGFVELE